MEIGSAKGSFGLWWDGMVVKVKWCNEYILREEMRLPDMSNQGFEPHLTGREEDRNERGSVIEL